MHIRDSGLVTFAFHRTTAPAWENNTATGRATATGNGLVYLSDESGTTGKEVRFDDIILKPLTASTLFACCGPLPWQDVIVETDWTITPNTQAGIWIAGDAATPANTALIYHDGTKLYLDQVIAGAYTNKINSTQAYLDDGTIRIEKSGTTFSTKYRGTAVGSTTITGLTGYWFGMFSTYAGNTCNEIRVWRNG
jgi:hypothetical protein